MIRQQESQPQCFPPASKNYLSDGSTSIDFSFYFFSKRYHNGKREPEEEFLQTTADLLPIALLSAALICRFGKAVFPILPCISASQLHNLSDSTVNLAQI